MKWMTNACYLAPEYYFSTKEVIERVTGLKYELFDDVIVGDFISAIQQAPFNVKGANLPFINEEIFKELLIDFFARYVDDPVCISDNKVLTDRDIMQFIIHLLNKVKLTWDYYFNLLNLYRENISKLMEDVKATSQTKSLFNDTPQLEGVQGFEGDDYATNLTLSKGESSTPLNTKIMRLKEIQDHYKNVLADWVSALERVVYIEIEGKEV